MGAAALAKSGKSGHDEGANINDFCVARVRESPA